MRDAAAGLFQYPSRNNRGPMTMFNRSVEQKQREGSLTKQTDRKPRQRRRCHHPCLLPREFQFGVGVPPGAGHVHVPWFGSRFWLTLESSAFLSAE